MVVDDDASVRLLVRSILEMAGFSVEEAEDGQRGLAAALKRPPDLLVLDLALPRVSGAQILAQLSHTPTLASVPVVVVSGLVSEGQLPPLVPQVRLVLGKPFDAAALLEMARRVADEYQRDRLAIP
jgi:CheY-like chemotaxis protein